MDQRGHRSAQHGQRPSIHDPTRLALLCAFLSLPSNSIYAKPIQVSLAAPTNQRPRAPPARHPSLILMCISPPHMHLTPIPLPGASTQRPATRSYYPTAFCRITLDSCTTNSAESTRMAPRCPSRPRRRRRSIRSICKPISTQPMSAMSATFVARRAPVSAVMVAICTAPARQRAPCPAPWQTIRFRKQTRPTAAGTPFPSARSTPSTSWPLWPTGCAGSISNDSVSLGASIDESCVFGATGAVNGSASFHKRICSPAPRHI
ncbi:uncharacterized protein BJ171DRAFT_507593, partial [Polychytrium aggregatum]|uniref:uncharacterized protein n=1 Tax=Polychytrium aggregatum TaxID=110093 RepID=UPI0022FDF607